jgi:hypothetical protein
MIIKNNIAVLCNPVPRLPIVICCPTSLTYLCYLRSRFGFQSGFVLLASDTGIQPNGDTVRLRVDANLNFLQREPRLCTKL